MRKLLWLLLFSASAFAQVPVIGSYVDAHTNGFQYHGTAPVGDTLCGNGTYYIDSPGPCANFFYQTVHNPVGTAMPQEPVLTFTNSFSCTDLSGASTQCDLGTVATPGTYANPASVTIDKYGRTTSVATGGSIAEGMTVTTGICTPTTSDQYEYCTMNIAFTTPFPTALDGATVNCLALPLADSSSTNGAVVCNVVGGNASGITVQIMNNRSITADVSTVYITAIGH